MQNSTDLLRRNLHEVFGERDQQRRKERIQELWAEDCSFVDPEGAYQGHNALDQMIETLQEQAPAFVFSETEPIQAHHDGGCIGWGFGPEGEVPNVTGIDFAVIRDGRIETMYTFLLSRPGA